MKVLQVNSVVNRGSTGRIAESIGQLVLKEGWESYVCWGRGDNETKSTPLKYGSKLSIITHVLRTRLFDLHGFGSSVSTKKLIKEIDRIKPDIVHLHNIHGYYLNIEVLFKYLSSVQVPVVWTLHDCWTFTGHCAYFDYSGCDKWKTECHSCPSLKDYPKSWFIDNSRSNFKRKRELFTSVRNITFVPVSNWLKRVLENSFFRDYPSRVIHNGIDLESFSISSNLDQVYSKYGLDKDVPIVLGVAGVWDRRKGLSDFLKIQERLTSKVQIVLVGLSKAQIKDLPSGIIGIERTESIKELAELYSCASVFVNPTYEDNFPTTNLESLACGTPVITYNTGGSPEAIDTETGYVVEKGDIDGLVEKIELISQKGKSFYQEKCRARAERLYNKDDRFADYIELYKEILKNK